MIDYLLRFPSKEVATQFGLASAVATTDESGETKTCLASHAHAMCIVGEHNSDGQWWVLFRDLVGIQIPEGIAPFIFWSSSLTTTDEDGNIVPLQRPISDDVPSLGWA